MSLLFIMRYVHLEFFLLHYFNMIRLLILLFALLGLVVSWYIYHKRVKNEKLVCIIGDDCDKVIKSKYGKTLGISNEITGMLYYSSVAIAVVLLYLGFEHIGIISIPLLLLIGGGFAAFFSTVLIFIQARIIKEWCEYCLVSSGVSIIIFILHLYD